MVEVVVCLQPASEALSCGVVVFFSGMPVPTNMAETDFFTDMPASRSDSVWALVMGCVSVGPV
jgi:hypothetical protein